MVQLSSLSRSQSRNDTPTSQYKTSIKTPTSPISIQKVTEHFNEKPTLATSLPSTANEFVEYFRTLRKRPPRLRPLPKWLATEIEVREDSYSDELRKSLSKCKEIREYDVYRAAKKTRKMLGDPKLDVFPLGILDAEQAEEQHVLAVYGEDKSPLYVLSKDELENRYRQRFQGDPRLVRSKSVIGTTTTQPGFKLPYIKEMEETFHEDTFVLQRESDSDSEDELPRQKLLPIVLKKKSTPKTMETTEPEPAVVRLPTPIYRWVRANNTANNTTTTQIEATKEPTEDERLQTSNYDDDDEVVFEMNNEDITEKYDNIEPEEGEGEEESFEVTIRIPRLDSIHKNNENESADTLTIEEFAEQKKPINSRSKKQNKKRKKKHKKVVYQPVRRLSLALDEIGESMYIFSNIMNSSVSPLGHNEEAKPETLEEIKKPESDGQDKTDVIEEKPAIPEPVINTTEDHKLPSIYEPDPKVVAEQAGSNPPVARKQRPHRPPGYWNEEEHTAEYLKRKEYQQKMLNLPDFSDPDKLKEHEIYDLRLQRIRELHTTKKETRTITMYDGQRPL
jgi:hypothetical protein